MRRELKPEFTTNRSFYKNNKVLPITEKAGREIVTIPTHPNLTTNNVNKIIDSINKFL